VSGKGLEPTVHVTHVSQTGGKRGPTSALDIKPQQSPDVDLAPDSNLQRCCQGSSRQNWARVHSLALLEISIEALRHFATSLASTNLLVGSKIPMQGPVIKSCKEPSETQSSTKTRFFQGAKKARWYS